MRHRQSLLFALVASLTMSSGALTAAGAATSPAVSCSTIVFTPDSGDGLFEIKARGISCRTARDKLRRARGVPRRLTGWTCTAMRHDVLTGSRRYHCTSRISVRGVRITRLIAYTTGN